MPVIARLRGIILRMFFDDHAPPHFHAENNDTNGVFNIANAQMSEGNLSSKDQKEIATWATERKDVLSEMWNSQEITKID